MVFQGSLISTCYVLNVELTLNIIYHCSLHMTINSFFISICLYLYHIVETDAGCFYHLDDAFSFYLTFLLADSADSG